MCFDESKTAENSFENNEQTAFINYDHTSILHSPSEEISLLSD